MSVREKAIFMLSKHVIDALSNLSKWFSLHSKFMHKRQEYLSIAFIVSKMKVALLLLGATGTSAFSSIGRLSSNSRSSSSSSSSQLQASSASSLEAILFDCDGVLADTERDGHRISFNIAFQENGIDESWDEQRYGKLLEVGGGKERMTAHWVS